MRVMVIGDTFASLASSDLLINNDSRIFFKEFFVMSNFLLTGVLIFAAVRSAGCFYQLAEHSTPNRFRDSNACQAKLSIISLN
jgi:hypothetical protein